jgi:hypothetical protein
MMYRLLHLTLFAVLVAVWPGNVGQAFTLQLAPLPPAEEMTPVSATADLPTPQLFRVALDARGLTLGVWPAAVGFQTPKIDVSRQDVPVPSPPQPAVMPNAQRTAALRLRGVEVLLLRHTETVASEPRK